MYIPVQYSVLTLRTIPRLLGPPVHYQLPYPYLLLCDRPGGWGARPQFVPPCPSQKEEPSHGINVLTAHPNVGTEGSHHTARRPVARLPSQSQSQTRPDIGYVSCLVRGYA